MLFFAVLSFSSLVFAAVDTVPEGRVFREGENLTSFGGKFVLGFFSPEGTTNRYVGIWYNHISPLSVVWVANRDKPLRHRNGSFGISGDGDFVVLDGTGGDPLWRTNVSATPNNASLVLTDGGELVICTDPERINGILWRSFDNPTDTFLPGMKVNVSTGERKIFTSWRNPGDPSPGRFTMGIDGRGSPQIVIWDGEKRRWRSGHWNRLVFLGVPGMRAISVYGFNLYNDFNGVYFKYTPSNPSDFIRFMVDAEGNELQQKWDTGKKEWSEIQYQPSLPCGIYNRCGKFATCDSSSVPNICSCMHGFVPNNQNEWDSGNWSEGCVRREELQCRRKNNSNTDNYIGKSDGFRKVKDIKLPDFADAQDDARSEEECKKKCEEDCSCNAYALVDGIPCMIWRGDLVDMQQFERGSGSTLSLRLPYSELGDKNRRRTIIIAATVGTSAATSLVSLAIWIVYKSRSKRKRVEAEKPNGSGESPTDLSGECQEGKKGSDLVMFCFSAMEAATNYFSHENKLGQGGFGHVYKGVLPSGQEVAVKRLSRKSGQGVQEFTNEVTVIAKLQHRNLVKLLGCCVEGDEKMLLYEYMPNKSLNSFLFDPAKRGELDWTKRYHIIEEIARGMLYLHRDSRLRIIHRDLKASNILLDAEMNPKISDFGMARIFGGNQGEENTNRVVGTYGYMAPEYAMEGLFSVKSDVYSFGVLLLEIVSGRRSASFRSGNHSGIVEYAWDEWDQGKPMNLMDPSIFSSCVPQQVLRCIQIGLLCVQDLAVHRPNMSAVVLFLETDNVALPAPRPPTYTASMRRTDGVDSWNQSEDLPSGNNITLSVIVGR
ncbi:unnamed protein product [Cuscuta campestris]|uniref:Receptor-like serine/threonine-protein kinase n=1 Tax=Cuscuta campestris TaxID=132261 RepID=A0A484MJ82_9ASTE|nr:unnamed protein product [Cuscuta campestris]